jgi:hypothetical protein
MIAHKRKRARRKIDIERGYKAGDELRDKGMARAASKNAGRINAGMANMVGAMLDRGDLTGTPDDIADRLDKKYLGGGKWVGSVIMELRRRNIIVLVDYVKSARRSRHGGLTGLYRLVGVEQARAFLASLPQHAAPERSAPAIDQIACLCEGSGHAP